MTLVAIHTENLSKTYKGNRMPAVDNLSIHIEKGAIYGLLGPNGAGKTTTISMLTGLIRPDSGNMFVFGQKLDKNSLRICGIVPQNIALYDRLTVMENLRFFGTMLGMKTGKLQHESEYWLQQLGLFEKRNEQIKNFSGGMKKRVNLIAGLLHQPQILFLDEPTAGIDVQSKIVILEKLRALNTQGVTIVYSSHLMEEAQHFCTHIHIIDYGKTIACGRIADLLAQHTDCNSLEAVFLKLTHRSLRN